MEFENMKKVWDSQNNEYMYTINEQALHERIIIKKNKASHITNISELLLIIVNLGAGSFVLFSNTSNPEPNVSLYILSAWMLVSGLYTFANRIKRLRGLTNYNRSVMGDLQFAVSVATYQVRLSQLNRFNVLPIGLLSISAMLESGKPVWISILIMVFFLLTFFASRWEHGLYVSRKSALEELQKKLVED